MKPIIPITRRLKAFTPGIGALLLALASGNLASAQTNTGTGPSPGPQFPVTTNGTGALIGLTTGKGNTGYGFNALKSITTGSGNTGIGANTLQSNIGGLNNVAVGSSALQNNTANGNTALGVSALMLNTTGTQNNAFGNLSLTANLSGSFNSAMGAQSLTANTSGASNTAYGYQALFKNTTGGLNVGIGDGALFNNTIGSGNIAMGEDAGFNLTVGSNNIAIGNKGVAGETGIIRIGTTGTHTDTFLTGVIHGNGSALTGVSVSASSITGTIIGTQIGIGAITATNIANATVATAKLATNAVTTAKILNAQVTSAKLAADLTLAGTTTGTFAGNFTGAVGIGTITPQAALHVTNLAYGIAPTAVFEGANCGLPCGQTEWTEMVRLYNSNSNGRAGLGFLTKAAATPADVPDVFLGTGDTATVASNSFRIATNLGGVLTDRMFIDGNSGNVGIGTTSPGSSLDVNGEITCNTLNVSAGFGVLTCVTLNVTSDRNAKEQFKPVNSREVLEKVVKMPISEWQYKAYGDARHIGPMAQDFHDAFLIGQDERHIATVDADGVAFAAIQGLNEKLEEKDAELTRLKSENQSLANRLAAIERALKLKGKAGRGAK